MVLLYCCMVFENCAKFPRNFKFYRLFRVCSKDEKKVYVECYKSQTYFKSRVYKKKHQSRSIHGRIAFERFQTFKNQLYIFSRKSNIALVLSDEKPDERHYVMSEHVIIRLQTMKPRKTDIQCFLLTCSTFLRIINNIIISW